jgi:hypothetical protein
MTTAKMKNEPAFPSSYTDMNNVPVRGMTLRDYFAITALGGICASSRGYSITEERLAAEAYVLADAMLKERTK